MPAPKHRDSGLKPFFWVIIMKYIIPVSGGKDSTALAIRLKELHPERKFIYVCTPTGDELPEMKKQWKTLEKILNQKIINVDAPAIEHLIDDFQMLPNWRSRWCTRIIKIESVQQFYLDNSPAVIYVGLRADEQGRGGNRLYDENISQEFPMQEWGWGLKEVLNYLDEKGVTIPRRTDCGMCFYQRIDEWYSLWEQYPDRFKKYEDIEFMIGHSLLSPGKWGGRWPEWLFELRCEFERGRIPKEVEWTRKKIEVMKKCPKLWPEKTPEPFDYGSRKKCRVCNI